MSSNFTAFPPPLISIFLFSFLPFHPSFLSLPFYRITLPFIHSLNIDHLSIIYLSILPSFYLPPFYQSFICLLFYLLIYHLSLCLPVYHHLPTYHLFCEIVDCPKGLTHDRQVLYYRATPSVSSHPSCRQGCIKCWLTLNLLYSPSRLSN